MPNAISPMLEQRILAMALAFPGWGPNRISLELGRPKWGGLKVSGSGGFSGAKDWDTGLNAWLWFAAMQHRRNRSDDRPSKSSTSRPRGPAIEYRWTGFTSAGWQEPGALFGNTRRLTSPARTPGPSSESHPRIQSPTRPRSWLVELPVSWRARVGSWRPQ